jgi:hypothetical protein
LSKTIGIKASYRSTAYGSANTALTKTATGFSASSNPYRYTSKRLDTDQYSGAVANLGLSASPLASNRYLFTGASPINQIELDGHNSTGIFYVPPGWTVPALPATPPPPPPPPAANLGTAYVAPPPAQTSSPTTTTTSPTNLGTAYVHSQPAATVTSAPTFIPLDPAIHTAIARNTGVRTLATGGGGGGGGAFGGPCPAGTVNIEGQCGTLMTGTIQLPVKGAATLVKSLVARIFARQATQTLTRSSAGFFGSNVTQLSPPPLTGSYVRAAGGPVQAVQSEATGGLTAAQRFFTQQTGVVPSGSVMTRSANGVRYIVRNSSTHGAPTVDVFDPRAATLEKIRFLP